MQRRSPRAFIGLFAAAVLAAGCGPTFMAASPHECEPAPVLQAAPVADCNKDGQDIQDVRGPAELAGVLSPSCVSCASLLSGAVLDLPRVFFGIGYAQLRPEDSSLETSMVYDLNVAYDLTSNLTFEFAFGLWDIPDRPVGIPDGDSDLVMRPALGMFQLSGEVPQWKARVYAAAGAGYSVNSYDLGRSHRDYVEIVEGVTDYSVRADDAFLWQLALGTELYSTADAALNFGVEIRYVWGTVERVERKGEIISNVDDVELNLYLIRANVTWHF